MNQHIKHALIHADTLEPETISCPPNFDSAKELTLIQSLKSNIEELLHAPTTLETCDYTDEATIFASIDTIYDGKNLTGPVIEFSKFGRLFTAYFDQFTQEELLPSIQYFIENGFYYIPHEYLEEEYDGINELGRAWVEDLKQNCPELTFTWKSRFFSVQFGD